MAKKEELFQLSLNENTWLLLLEVFKTFLFCFCFQILALCSQMAQLGIIHSLSIFLIPYHLMPRPGFEPESVSKVALTQDLRRTLYRLSYRVATLVTHFHTLV